MITVSCGPCDSPAVSHLSIEGMIGGVPKALDVALIDVGGTLWPNSWPFRQTDGAGRHQRDHRTEVVRDRVSEVDRYGVSPVVTTCRDASCAWSSVRPSIVDNSRRVPARTSPMFAAGVTGTA